MRTPAEVRLAVRLDRTASDPLPVQLADQVRAAVAAGVLAPGEPLPSTRALAGHLGVARGTVVHAYDQLLAEGYLAASGGRGTVVHPRLARVGAPRTASGTGPRGAAPAEDLLDLRPGRPSTDRLTTAAWRAAWREAAVDALDASHDAAGSWALRVQLADHLRRMRGAVRPVEAIVVTSGAREGLRLLLEALPPGPVGVEDPGYPTLRQVPARLGRPVVGLPADARGLVTDALPDAGVPAVVVVTPSHQYPLGGSLPVDRRLALLAWARRHAVWVVEDDFDAELRYSSQPLPALAALDDAADPRVVTLGTFARTLTPALGVGYLAAPPPVAGRLAAVRAELGQPASLLVQEALARYLAGGELRRHVQRMRRLYRARRALVREALDDLPGVRVYPMDGGLHAVVETDAPEEAVVAAVREQGVRVDALSTYWASGVAGRTPHGLVLGIGGTTDAEFAAGLAAVSRAVAPAPSSA